MKCLDKDLNDLCKGEWWGKGKIGPGFLSNGFFGKNPANNFL